MLIARVGMFTKHLRPLVCFVVLSCAQVKTAGVLSYVSLMMIDLSSASRIKISNNAAKFVFIFLILSHIPLHKGKY